MSRNAFYNALVEDPGLNDLGLNEATVFPNWSSEERPTVATPFMILRWGEQSPPVFRDRDAGDVDSAVTVRLWVHWPNTTTDYGKVIKVLDAVDDCVKEMRDLPGSDNRTLSFVEKGGRSEDITDSGFNTIAKYGVYSVYSRRS